MAARRADPWLALAAEQDASRLGELLASLTDTSLPKLQARFEAAEADAAAAEAEAPAAPPARGRAAAAAPADTGILGQVLNSSVGKSMIRTAAVAVTGTLVRGMLGALLGGKKTTTRSTRRR